MAELSDFMKTYFSLEKSCEIMNALMKEYDVIADVELIGALCQEIAGESRLDRIDHSNITDADISNQVQFNDRINVLLL